ncbi:MAG: hypothetical protein PsegKO_27990 [Pseudohongiellaceae bacterium]
MINQKHKIAIFCAASIALVGCMSTSEQLGEDASSWDNYQSWYKANPEPNTGDPTGFLGGVHEGTRAYRDIYVNARAEPTNRGQSGFPYPAGSILVKETYSNEQDYQERQSADLTIMVKLPAGTSPETSDWEYVMGADGSNRGSGTSGLATFCHGCHTNASDTDFNFINSRFNSNN